MFSESATSSTPAAVWRACALDFSSRADLCEWMDEPCTYGDLRGCLHDLAQVNRTTCAYAPTLRFVSAFAHRGAARPLHVVDVGCGGGDMLRVVERWARRRRVPVRLTGIDINPLAIRAAREFAPESSRIRWIAGDARALSEPADLIVSSLLTHHLTGEQIVRFLQWMESAAALGWFVNDLYRTRISYLGFHLLSLAARWHPFVAHDGPISIRRAFAPRDWRLFIEQAALPSGSVRIHARWPVRICISRIKPS